jgi:hypothetical protein
VVTEPLLDTMISGHPVITQIKTLLNEAKQVAAVAKAAVKTAQRRTGCQRRQRNDHPQGEVN